MRIVDPNVAPGHANRRGRVSPGALLRADLVSLTLAFLVAELGFGGTSHVTHRLIGPADPLPYYAAADALILPSFYDPFPSTVIEALACGLPVVTTIACVRSVIPFAKRTEPLVSEATAPSMIVMFGSAARMACTARHWTLG